MGSLSKSTGHMLVVRERIHQVGSELNIRFMFEQTVILGELLAKILYNICFFQCAGHYNIFVGDLSPEVTDATLFACFSVYPSCS